MNTQTPTFQRLADFELGRTESARRTYTQATALWSFLLALSDYDKSRRFHPVAPTTYKRHLRDLRAAGVAPLKDPADLAALARDLGIFDPASLVRLVSALNADGLRRPDRIITAWTEFVAAARALLEHGGNQDEEEAEGVRAWAGGREWPSEAALLAHLRTEDDKADAA
jgi:hypothetical protein